MLSPIPQFGKGLWGGIICGKVRMRVMIEEKEEE